MVVKIQTADELITLAYDVSSNSLKYRSSKLKLGVWKKKDPFFCNIPFKVVQIFNPNRSLLFFLFLLSWCPGPKNIYGHARTVVQLPPGLPNVLGAPPPGSHRPRQQRAWPRLRWPAPRKLAKKASEQCKSPRLSRRSTSLCFTLMYVYIYIYIYTNLHLYTYIANGYPPKKQSLLWMTGSSISGLYHCPRLFFWNWLLLYTPTNQASSIASVNHTFTLQQGKPNLPIGSSGMQIASASPLLFDPYQCQPQPKDPIETHGKSPWVWAKVLHSL